MITVVELKCDTCGKTFKRKPCKIKRAEKHYCSNACRYKGQEQPKHKSWVQDGIVHLEITKGNIVLLDEADRDLADLNWQTRKNYAARKDKDRKHIYMHRLVAERIIGRSLKPNEIVDHLNSNGLDNRRSNVRLVTNMENSENAMKHASTNTNRRFTSKFKGVSFERELGKWRTQITFHGITYHLGYFDNEEDAAKAYDMNAIVFYGNHAKLNFPDEWYAWPIHKKNGCAYKVEA